MKFNKLFSIFNYIKYFLTEILFIMCCIFSIFYATNAVAEKNKISIIAAENFYADIAKQIGGNLVTVKSILNHPAQDPHLFEANIKTAKELEKANLIIYNGLNYDPWMKNLLSSSKKEKENIIIVSELFKEKFVNPHIWYNLKVIPVIAKKIYSRLSKIDALNKNEFQKNLIKFLKSLKLIDKKISYMRSLYINLPITATEPVFEYMSDAIGFIMKNKKFQLAVMNGTEASALDIINFKEDLSKNLVRVLIYNNQSEGALTKNILMHAKKNNIPIVNISETKPINVTYQEWMLNQLNNLDESIKNNIINTTKFKQEEK